MNGSIVVYVLAVGDMGSSSMLGVSDARCPPSVGFVGAPILSKALIRSFNEEEGAIW